MFVSFSEVWGRWLCGTGTQVLAADAEKRGLAAARPASGGFAHGVLMDIGISSPQVSQQAARPPPPSLSPLYRLVVPPFPR